MIDSIFVEGSPILRWFRIRQIEIRKSDRVRFAKPMGLEAFL